MKLLKRAVAAAVCLCTAFSFAACGESNLGEDFAAPEGGAAGWDCIDGGADDAGAENGREANGESGPLPGQLTAGEWNDNENYDFFKSLFLIGEWCLPDENGVVGTVQNGIFAEYQGGNSWGLETQNRIEVKVTGADGKPAAGAEVWLTDGGERLLSARADANGRAYLFPDNETFARADGVSGGYGTETVAIQNEGDRYEITLTEEGCAYTQLDLCFMIDTTGSMGDELNYLQAELGDVISRVQAELPGADIGLALVFYRDAGDEYVVKTSDFTSDVPAQQRALKQERASGGGDYPEAVHEALAAALGLSWRENSRKILIPVLDAPPHADATEQGTKRDIRADFGALVYDAAERGIAAVPVAASGADTLTQYLMRSTALVTGGTYVFLTNDSGIGYDHDMPTVGEFTVEYLNSCLVRVISGLYDGVGRPAVYYKQDASGAAK